MITMDDLTLSGPGLTVSKFFSSLSETEIRDLIDPGILSTIDATSGGEISTDNLKEVASTLLDVNSLLGESYGRKTILSLLPEFKLSELEDRVGNSFTKSDDWTESEINRARDFFNLREERITPPQLSPISEVNSCYGLFDHQRKAANKIIPLLFEGDRRAVLHLPTGVGKTRTAMHIIVEALRNREPSLVIWLASSKELLEQAVHAFQEAWSHLGNRTVQLGSMWGDLSPDLLNFTDGFLAIGLAKGWSKSRSDQNWAIRLSPKISLVVFDEAHQCIAETYRRLTDELTNSYKCGLLGLTATPGRTWADIDEDSKLSDYFHGNKVALEVEGENPIHFLIDNGFLAKPNFRTVFSEPGHTITDAEIKRMSNNLDIPTDILESLSMSQQYITAVFKSIIELLDSGKFRILVFTATVDHARVLAAILAQRKIQALVVTGETPLRIRDRSITKFKSTDRDPMVLLNFGVLTTGFDAPQADAVVIARPTKSLVLYSQMVGRAIRGPKAGGTETCEIVSVIDPALPGFGDISEAFLNWEDIW